jgi:putative Holliday junction resolvase
LRILGIDHGERRTGFAVSDPLGITAQGLDTFDAKEGTDILDHIAGIVGEYGVDEVVVGYPLGLSGQVGESAERATALARRIEDRTGLEVTLWDERFSSEEAKRVLRGQRSNKSDVDKLSAVIILQSYLDYRGGGG